MPRCSDAARCPRTCRSNCVSVTHAKTYKNASLLPLSPSNTHPLYYYHPKTFYELPCVSPPSSPSSPPLSPVPPPSTFRRVAATPTTATAASPAAPPTALRAAPTAAAPARRRPSRTPKTGDRVWSLMCGRCSCTAEWTRKTTMLFASVLAILGHV
ncbi:hypothetical protein MIND_00383800 [Mycena indigotica]|uniref:Uncharacterized protein n=1 Tax=Mycena indigotica TaxID=2126181 RepID=A0A8H6T639_9AGAR|nr:uncharacterized protein MIND_00383800 [Mycena indigotica]KAF7310105.1 hypothetical protein MIND_00383800 [Mycena indigotica]